MATKLQQAIATCESYLRDYPQTSVFDAVAVLWDSFALAESDISVHKQIWFPDGTQEEIQRALIHRVTVTSRLGIL